MDKDRNEILNELIHYYDGDKPETPDAPDANGGNMGDTRVISRSKPEPRPSDEQMGNTVVFAPEKEERPVEEKDDTPVSEPTRQIPVQPSPRPVKKPAQPVREEVLGNLDIAGRPIEIDMNATRRRIPVPEQSEGNEAMSTRSYNRNIQRAEKPAPSRNEPPYEEIKRRSGVWYALKPLWVSFILCAVFACAFKFYVTDTGIIGTYKRNFNYNMGLLMNMFGIEWESSSSVPVVGENDSNSIFADSDMTLYIADASSGNYTERDNVREEEKPTHEKAGDDKAVVPFAEAGSSDFSVFKDGVVCAKSNYIGFINKNGDVEWEYETSMANPILSANGRYIAIASGGGTQLSLYNGSKQIYSIDAPDKIRACKVSEKGDVVLLTEKNAYKGAVVLINTKGEVVFSWSSGANFITSATVLNNRKIAVALVSAEKAVTSYVMMFDINSTDPLSGIELSDSLIYDVQTDGKNVYAGGDNSISYITDDSEIKYDLRYDDVTLTHSVTDYKGCRLITYTQDNIPIMSLYSKNGELADSKTIEGAPDFIDLYDDTVLYNNGRDIICGNAYDEEKTLYTAPRKIRNLKLIDDSAYVVVYEDCIEIVRI